MYGYNFSGFGLLLYKLAENKDPNSQLYGQHIGWGAKTIAIVWIPALVKTSLLVLGLELDIWQNRWQKTLLNAVIGLVLLTLIWPVFSICL